MSVFRDHIYTCAASSDVCVQYCSESHAVVAIDSQGPSLYKSSSQNSEV
jgi:hypothetical protein